MAGVELTVGPMRPEERPALERAIAQALHFSRGRMAYWMEGAGPANYRAVRAAGRPVGGLALLPLGQWFGGARVPMAGIGSLGIAPEWRGRGAASALLRATLAELREAGTALATLFPSTLPVYRKAGFGSGGSTFLYELALASIHSRAPLDLVPVAGDEWGALAAIRERRAGREHGAVERTPFLWRKILAPYGQETFAYQIARGDSPEGYLIYAQGEKGAPLQVLDWCIEGGDAGLTLLAFLAGDRAMSSGATLRAAPDDPLLQLLAEQSYTIRRAQPWLLRIVDAAGALRARGYHPALAGELHLAIADDLLPANAGDVVLRVADGRGTVETGGRGALRLDIRALAPLYTGHLTASQLVSIGALAGPAEAIRLADLIFGGARPRLIDGY